MKVHLLPVTAKSRWLYLTIITFFSVLLASGCQSFGRVTIPPSDTTAPEIFLLLNHESDGYSVTTESEDLLFKTESSWQDSMTLKADAKDYESGVRVVAIVGKIIVYCREPSPEPLVVSYREENRDKKDSRQYVTGGRWTELEIDLKELCPQGQIIRIDGNFVAKAENYLGGENETALLGFTYLNRPSIGN